MNTTSSTAVRLHPLAAVWGAMVQQLDVELTRLDGADIGRLEARKFRTYTSGTTA